MRLLRLFGILSLIAPSLFLTGCLYKMPTDENICTLPNTNNPQVTRERSHSVIPGK